MTTQSCQAKNGNITEQMNLIAQDENLPPEFIREEVALGRAVIPANKLHLKTNLKPMAIGSAMTVKINANIGASNVKSSLEAEIEKMNMAISLGADTIMDLSTGEDLDLIRETLLSKCSVPFGTVPIYEVIIGKSVEQIDNDTILKVIEKQAAQGVDFFTIHAGLLKEHLELVQKRTCGIVSRGGALLAKWMIHHNRQNPLYELFDDICRIMEQYDVCFSLGDGLRPGCVQDATDDAQIAELRTLGELTQRARENNCQVMVEGPGHVPFDQIEKNMKLQQQICQMAPFYVLGPLVTDIAPGYDHITSAIGATAAAFYGASYLCYVTPREHLGLPDLEDVRRGVIASKIAAHAADIAKGNKIAKERDLRISTARANLDWKSHLAESLDPQTAKIMHDQACKQSTMPAEQDPDYCTMCGRDWCSVRINKELKQEAAVKK